MDGRKLVFISGAYTADNDGLEIWYEPEAG